MCQLLLVRFFRVSLWASSSSSSRLLNSVLAHLKSIASNINDVLSCLLSVLFRFFHISIANMYTLMNMKEVKENNRRPVREYSI